LSVRATKPIRRWASPSPSRAALRRLEPDAIVLCRCVAARALTRHRTSKDSRSILAAFRGYLLPRSAYESLIETREQLRLLAEFTYAHSEPPERILIRPGSLSEMFERVAAYLDDALSLASATTPNRLDARAYVARVGEARPGYAIRNFRINLILTIKVRR